MKRTKLKLVARKGSDPRGSISQYFKLPVANGAAREKTPEKTSSPDNDIALLSPDMLPPTPPLPKRSRLEGPANAALETRTKLKPKALLPVTSVESNVDAPAPVGVPTPEPKIEAICDAAESPKEAAAAGGAIRRDLYHLGRHRVVECELSDNRLEKRLTLKPEDESVTQKRQCLLRDFWLNTAVKVGDVVHIHADWHGVFDEHGDDMDMAIIDRTNGLLVVQPDVLISGTSVVATLFCRRKAVLSERFRGVEPTSRVMLNGTLVHRLLQTALRDQHCDTASMRRMIDDLLSDSSTLHDLYGAQLLREDVQADVQQFVPMIQYFVGRYIDGKNVKPPAPPSSATASGDRSRPSAGDGWHGRIRAVADIEENIWSPWLGIKGKVDLTVEAEISGHKGTVRMPLELKTGRSTFSAEHKGQVTLYSMMMNQSKNGRPNAAANPGGLLLYLRDGAIQQVPAGHCEQQALIQLRNELVDYLTMPTRRATDNRVVEGLLPPRIDRLQMCKQCPFLTECTIYQEAENAVASADPCAPSPDPIPPELSGALAHLSDSHRRYFLQWSLMLRLEWEEGGGGGRKRGLSDIWCLDPTTRQANGTCLGHLRVAQFSASQFHTSELDQFSVRLASTKGEFPRHLQLQCGDSVVLSTDSEVAVATGCLVEIGTHEITVSTDRNFSQRRDQLLHVDRLEYQGGQAMLYSNLSRLMADNGRAAKLRQLVVDRRPAVFQAGLPKSVAEVGRPVLSKLNKLQRKAVLKALTCDDYCLIHGLPGTGKTSLIVALMRMIVKLGQTVLLTSYTHSAVDNVLLKLLEHDDAPFVRIGRQHRTHPAILPRSAEILSRQCRTVDDLQRLYSAPIVAGTCLSANHPALQRRRFDFCIVDEAGQVQQAATLGPLMAADKFVLVGDPLQLPPVVQSRTAKSMGMDESLFVRLSSATSDAVAPLQFQYRMCGPVNELANKLTYGGDLQCGNETVERASLPSAGWADAADRYADRPWLVSVVRPDLTRAVVFLDTNLLAAAFRCSTTDPSTRAPVNRCEAAVALAVVEALLDAGVSPEDVGLIAPYQSQVKLLKDAAMTTWPQLEINTVDQYQGRDKAAILYTCTKSQTEDVLQDDRHQTILHDLRRLTVAVTRAKHKLVVVGDSATLRQYPPFAKLLDALETHQWHRLVDGADGFSTQKLRTSSPAFQA